MKYNIETIKQLCEPYGYAARNSGYMLYINKVYSEDEEVDKENWWKPEIFCRTVNDEYLEDEYTIDRFAISFSGYGTLSLEEENKVMEYLKKAKESAEATAKEIKTLIINGKSKEEIITPYFPIPYEKYSNASVTNCIELSPFLAESSLCSWIFLTFPRFSSFMLKSLVLAKLSLEMPEFTSLSAKILELSAFFLAIIATYVK